MPANLTGIEITDSDASVYNFEIYKRGDNQQRGVSIATREWEIGDPQMYWKVPLFPYDGGLRQDRLPRTASLTIEHNRPRTYAKGNVDASNDGLLVPPPSIDSHTIQQIATQQVSFGNKQIFLCARYIYAIDRDESITVDKDFGTGKAGVSMAIFNNELIVGMGETEKIWKRSFSGTWTQATDATYAIALGVVGNKLWRAESTNELSNCITTPLTLANWTPADPNEYLAGDTTYAVHTIIDYGGVPWVLKADGAYAPDSKSDFYNQAPQLASWAHENNGKGAFTAQGYLWVPTVIGLLRISFGESLIRGPEKSNRPDFRFWVRGGVEWGESIYLLVTDETGVSDTFICKMDKDKYGLTEGQEYIYHEWCRLPGGSVKGYTIGVNTWPAVGPITILADSGTQANVAGAGIDWTNPTNAATSNDTYATLVGSGASDALRFSNFGFAIPTDATLLGFLVSLERKTSIAQADSTEATLTAANLTGIGSRAWTISSGGSPPNDRPAGTIVYTDGVNYTSNYIKFTDFGFAIPSTAVINGVRLRYYRQGATSHGGYVQDNSVRLVVSGAVTGENRATATLWPSTIAQTTNGDNTTLWGVALTPAIVNSSTFGFAVSGNAVNGEAMAVGAVNGDTEITVWYTDAGTTDTTVQIRNASGAAVGDNKALTPSWPSADETVTYGGDSDLWGTSLTPADVNDTDFGFSIIITNPSAITASIDYGYMAVTYLESAITIPPYMFVGQGLTLSHVVLGYGAGRSIDDPNYPFGAAMEIESGLFQPVQNVTLIAGLVGVSVVGQIRTGDSITLQYANAEDTSYSNLLTTQEGSGTAAITSDGTYGQFTRYAPPNTTSPYFKIKLSGTLTTGSGTDRCEIRAMWAFGYARPKVTDLIKVPIYADRLALHNGIPQGATGGDTLRRFRAWKRDQTVVTLRFPDYEEVRTVRARVFDIEGDEIIAELDSTGRAREVMVVQVTFIRDDFAGEYGNV